MVPRIVSAASAKYGSASSSICRLGALTHETIIQGRFLETSSKHLVATVDLSKESYESRYVHMFDKTRTDNTVNQNSAVRDSMNICLASSCPIHDISSQDSSIHYIISRNATSDIYHKLSTNVSVADARCMVKRRIASEQEHDGDDRHTIPAPPTDCCMSGCANCVWIQYAEDLKRLLGDSGKEQVLEEINKIENPGLQLFIKFELGYL